MMNDNNLTPEQSLLGKSSGYDAHYNPGKLFPIPRKEKREEISIPQPLPFAGFDLWNHYEVSWLNNKGKPVVALAEISYDCETPCIIESKSMKLYFNSFNNTKFENEEVVRSTIESDIGKRVGGLVVVNIIPLNKVRNETLSAKMAGGCIDDLDIECSAYLVDATFLEIEEDIVEEVLTSNLLKSNCLVTHQPDWASVQIAYKGRKINRESLLRYLVSFRNHNEFHEQCIERIFMDIMHYCRPEELTVYGRYTRRGGLDINPYRSTNKNTTAELNKRLCRQ